MSWWVKFPLLSPYHPVNSGGHKPCERGDSFLNLSKDLPLVTYSKDHVTLRVGASHGKSLPC